jgi:(2Fe-2S) ferredoxin
VRRRQAGVEAESEVVIEDMTVSQRPAWPKLTPGDRRGYRQARSSVSARGGTLPRHRRASADEVTGCTVTVCRGCCCGTDRKHPGVDHNAQVDVLTTGIGDAGQVRTSECLDACERSNVVVVGPSPGGRRAGARPVWLSGVLHPGTVAEIVEWVRQGGPGVHDPPGFLDLWTFTPTRRSRVEAGEV